ncbi:MAG: aminotransferase class V-fold PLP-dependent enzyme [Rhodobacteraceae bacterium]|nr:aminotransferase class V-fold PLP-dependent enzyme [Paracoccaceae bacterium]
MFANGRPYLAIPGPSVMPDVVLREMHRAAPNIYAGELVDITAKSLEQLKALAGTKHGVAIYIANGHGLWEAILSNAFSAGDHVLVPATGMFGHGWADVAAGLGLKVEVMELGMSAAVDPDVLEQRLRADTGHSIRAVLAVHTDTSTSLRSDIPALRAAIDRAAHPALLLADCMASLGCEPFHMDDWGVDLMMAGSQKGLMTPPGIGFVFVGPKAAALREKTTVSRYWDWKPRTDPEAFWQHFFGTAPTHHIYGLHAALNLIEQEGRDAVWARHEGLARAIWAAVEAWGTQGAMRLNVTSPAHRSHAVTAIEIGGEDGDRLRAWCEQVGGVTLGIGLGREPASAFFRIGHMGHVNAHMVLGALAVIDAGLKALDIAHGPGAVEAATGVIARLSQA